MTIVGDDPILQAITLSIFADLTEVENVMFFTCHLTSRNQVTLAYDFMVVFLYHLSYHPVQFASRRFHGSGNITFFIIT